MSSQQVGKLRKQMDELLRDSQMAPRFK